jgi:hypothetical protein
MVRFWPTLGVIATILPTQWLMAPIMAHGSSVTSSMIAILLAAMIGSVVTGHF